MDCPTCGAPAHPDGPDTVYGSSDGPLLFTRWRCASNHWWHMTTDVSPVHATEAERGPADWLANEIALAVVWSHVSRPGLWPG